MEAVQSSVVGSLALVMWSVLRGFYEYSALAGLFRLVAEAWKRAWHGSILVELITRDGVLSRSWKSSVSCRILSLLLNLPAAVLHWVYLRFQPVFDASVAASLAFGAGEQTPAAIGWLFFGLIIIPYEHWNNLYSLIGFFLMLLLLLAGGMRRRSLRLDPIAVGPYAVCYAAAVFLAFPLSAFPGLSFRFLFFHITGMLCVLITVSAIEREEQLMRLLSFACLGLSTASVIAVVQRIQGVEVNPSFVDLTVNEGMPGRVFAGFENPNAFAEVLCMLIPLAVALMLGSRGWGGRFLGCFSAGLGVVAIFMTYGRASWIGLAVAALLFVFLWNRKLLPALLLLAVAAVPLLPDTIFNRILTIFNSKDTSTSSRFPLYTAALRLLKVRPILGGGLGTDAVRQTVKDLNLYHGVAPFVHAHDVYLQVWAESGLLGVVSFIGAMGWSIKQAIRSASSETCPYPVRLAAIGGASAVTGILVCGLADYIWNYPRVMMIFWFVVAVTLSAVRLAKRASHNGGNTP